MGKTVLVCVAKDWSNSDAILRELRELKSKGYTKVITYRFSGAGSLTGKVAVSLHMELIELETNKMLFREIAPYVVNTNLISMKPDFLLAFHNDLTKSRVVKDAVVKALRKEISVKLITE